MKKYIYLFTLTFHALLFAQPEIPHRPSVEAQTPEIPPTANEVISNNYTDLGVQITTRNAKLICWPSISFGRRSITTEGIGVDASASLSIGKDLGSGAWALPKVQFLQFLSSTDSVGQYSHLYYGIGASFGGIYTETWVNDTRFQGLRVDRTRFTGFLANASLGAELYRNNRVSAFGQVEVLQPAIAFWQENPVYLPSMQFKAGLGF